MMATSAGETTPGASVSREVEGEIVEYSPKRVYGRVCELSLCWRTRLDWSASHFHADSAKLLSLRH